MLRSFQVGIEVRKHGINWNEISISEIKQTPEKSVWLVQLEGKSRFIFKQFGSGEHDLQHYQTELSALQGISPSGLVPTIEFYEESTRIICTEHMGAYVDGFSPSSGISDIHLNYEIDRNRFQPHFGLPGVLSWFASRPNGLNYLQQSIVDRVLDSVSLRYCAESVLDEWSEVTLIHGDMKNPHVFHVGGAYRFCDWEYSQFGRIEWDLAGLAHEEVVKALDEKTFRQLNPNVFARYCRLRSTDVRLLQKMTALRLAQTAVEMLSGSDSLSRRSIETLMASELLASRPLLAG